MMMRPSRRHSGFGTSYSSGPSSNSGGMSTSSDGAASLINDGVTPPGNVSYLDVFPYLDHPVSGYDVQPLSA